MNKQTTVTQTICRIGDETFEKLKSLSIPPYPKYYYETFMDTLHNGEDTEVIELSKKFGYLFSMGESGEALLENSLSIAKESLENFHDSSKNIRQLSQNQGVELTQYQKEHNPTQISGLLTMFSTFQEQVLGELQNAEETIVRLRREVETLERESNIDPLTKAYNRKALMHDLKDIVSFGQNRKLDLHVALLDADDFKVINDQFGHIAGDKTLIYLTKLLQSSLRRGTRVYRYGGEEFVVILNRMTHNDTLKTLERIIKEASESKLFYKGNNIHLTLSAGLTTHREGDTPEEILDRADKALYNAKLNGKNCFREE
jgi:diguanylate cyclase (GGDEF)-like protein